MFRSGLRDGQRGRGNFRKLSELLRDLRADAALCCHPQLASRSLQQNHMASSRHEAKPLSVYRTFVVQLHAGADEGHCSGRVEHVASGRSAQFSSVQALLEFLSDNNSDEGSPPQARVR